MGSITWLLNGYKRTLNHLIVKLYLRWLTNPASNVVNQLIQAAPATDLTHQARIRNAPDVREGAISRVTALALRNATAVVNMVIFGESARVATAAVATKFSLYESLSLKFWSACGALVELLRYFENLRIRKIEETKNFADKS